jgi:hypothetical protein
MAKLIPDTRRLVCTALMLALALGLAGAAQPGPALAAPRRATELKYFMTATKLRGTALICVGDGVGIDIKVVRAQVTNGVAVNAEAISGAKVTGAVQDASIGTLAPATNWTGWHGEKPGETYFTFSAIKAGTTTISFEGKIHYQKGILEHFSMSQRNDLVSDTVDVTVQNCAYQVTVSTTWSEPSRKHTAMIEQVPMIADAPGHYKATAPVKWIVREVVAVNGCPLHAVIPTSQADLTAVLGKDGQQLVVDVTYQPLQLVWHTYRSDDCTQGSEIDSTNTAARLTFSVGANGGSGKLPQTLTVPGYGVFTSKANATVTRVPRP